MAGAGVPLAYMIAGILMVLALGASGRTAIRLGLPGLCLAVGTALVTHNAASLPHLVGALLVGSAAGLMVATRTPPDALPRLLAGACAAAGLSVLVTSVVIRLDPQALGLGDPIVNVIEGWPRLAVGITMLLGATTAVGGGLVALRPTGKAPVLAFLGSLLGWSAAIWGLVLQNPAMLVAGTAAGSFAAIRGIAALSRRRLSP
jgi:NAD(P) transhydrogenase subunit beta